MPTQVLYVYAIARAGHPLPDVVEAVDGSGDLAVVAAGEIAAIYTAVDGVDFSQAVIDTRSGDVEWLGAIGYRHQTVMSQLMKGGTVIPLRAFTLFGSEASLHAHLAENAGRYRAVLDRLDGKQEWTLRIELRPDEWNEALSRRVESLRRILAEMESAGSGKAYLLRKKVDEEKKRASRAAEEELVREVESEAAERLRCETIAESRTQRGGGFPQINLLINRDEEAPLLELREALNRRYEGDGVSIAITGPWPPYSFV